MRKGNEPPIYCVMKLRDLFSILTMGELQVLRESLFRYKASLDPARDPDHRKDVEGAFQLAGRVLDEKMGTDQPEH